eukprot:TRINITY_DN11216_c0_g1_i1.p1 TRINITY_DN11216_c0_g1~~TRINITY_DN11216_c0_g1_i1.p1  ORF type:complete len:452 (-),score=66.76 TRINITY_DN11216_c0_g1_i1:57-1412(-)
MNWAARAGDARVRWGYAGAWCVLLLLLLWGVAAKGELTGGGGSGTDRDAAPGAVVEVAAVCAASTVAKSSVTQRLRQARTQHLLQGMWRRATLWQSRRPPHSPAEDNGPTCARGGGRGEQEEECSHAQETEAPLPLYPHFALDRSAQGHARSDLLHVVFAGTDAASLYLSSFHWIRSVLLPFVTRPYAAVIQDFKNVVSQETILLVTKDEPVDFLNKRKAHKENLKQQGKESLLRPIGVLYFGGKTCKGNEWFGEVEFVLNVGGAEECPNVWNVPLGWRAPPLPMLGGVHLNASMRRHPYAFIGVPSGVPRQMLLDTIAEDLADVPGFVYEMVDVFHPSVMGATEASMVLRDSAFVFCPPTTVQDDTARVYEALQAGAIPIVQLRKQLRDALFGGHHPFVEVNTWADATYIVRALWEDKAQVDALQATVAEWWDEYKHELGVSVGALVDRL